MLRCSLEVTAFGGLVLLLTGCGGLLGGGDDDCAAADCGGGSSGRGGSGGTAGIGPGRGGASGAGDSGRGGTGTESGGSTGLTGGSGGSGGSTGGSVARGGTSATRGGSSGSAGAGTSGTAGTSGKAGEAGASSVADQCTRPSDCTLVAVDCCGSCQPKASDFVALNRDAVGDYLQNRPCTDRLCPECAPIGTEWLTAICVTGLCQVLDARESELSACEVSDDCRLRNTLECCECGAEGGWVSLNVSSSATLTGLVCDHDQACDDCVPIAPPTLAPTCVEGRCQTMLPTR